MTAWEYYLLIGRRRPDWTAARALRVAGYIEARNKRGDTLALRSLRATHSKVFAGYQRPDPAPNNNHG